MPVVEQFGEDSRGDVFPYSGEIPPPRVWFESGDSNRLIQVQRDRFLHNWKKERDADIYPHYDHVVGNFRTSLETFEKFLEDRKLGRIEPTQYELTYINHVLKEDGWEEPDDIGNIFPDFSWRKSDKRFLRTPESMNWQTSFLLPERSGRLRLSIRLGRRKSDQRTTILLELTARGIGVDKTRSSMWSWFDMAHEWIVCGFTDLTAEDIHRKFWRRIR